MINKIINSEKFRKRFYNASNLKLEELTKLLEKSAKTIITQESNKTKEETKVRVLLYNEDNDVRGYSFNPSSNLETRTIGINIKNHNMTDSADLVETIFHESYDEKKHNNNEWSAIRFGRYARRLWDMVVRVNNFTYLENSSNFTKINISDPRIEDATKETKKIYKKVKTLGYKAGIFNEAKIMARVLDKEWSEEYCKNHPDKCVAKSKPSFTPIHYEIFFEDEEGGHIGFYGDGYFGGIFQEGQIRPDDEINLEKYNQVIMDNLDDKIMREAIDLAIKEGIKKYGLTHHCQHFVMDDVMPRYNEIYNHRKMIAKLEVKLGDKIGRIKDELGAGLGAGLDARPRAEFDNRPGGIGNGLGNGVGNGVGGLGGNGFGNGFDIGGGIGNRPGGIGFDNRPGGFRDGLDARPRAEFDNRPGGIGNGLGGIGGLGNGPGGVRGELGAGLGAMLDAGLGPGGRLGGEHGGVGNNNRPGGFGGGGWNPGNGGFGGMNFGGGPGGFGRF